MTIQEFIGFWQAQPFRPFRLHTGRGVFAAAYPLQIGLTPTLRVALVVDEARVETFTLEEITHGETTGDAVDLATLIGALPPETIARNAALLAAATTDPAGDAAALQAQEARRDPGEVRLRGARAADGVYVVQARVSTREGTPIFATTGTRWNLHGYEQFENGTSLYLHHLDHPTTEQRIILWPPDRGTFESFAEAMPLASLTRELRRRDAKLAAKPATEIGLKAAYFRSIMLEYPPPLRDREAEARGADAPELDPDRYELAFRAQTIEGGRVMQNPVLTDFLREEIIFNLAETDWDADGTREGQIWRLRLRHGSHAGREFALCIDCNARVARVDQDDRDLPLAFIERHLCNFALYEPWGAMFAALRAGPAELAQRDVMLSIPGGFRAELWPGETRFPLPFLQPRIVDPAGRAVFDLRTTTWAAGIRVHEDRPEVTLAFVSHETENRDAAAMYPVVLDLVTLRVTCPTLDGSTTIGMLQALVRHVRGTKWMLEELPAWLAKGRFLPTPGSDAAKLHSK